jgi:hypothetical protein
MLVKCGGIAVLADVVAAHVDLQAHHRVVDRHRLGHQLDDLAGGRGLANVYISMNFR